MIVVFRARLFHWYMFSCMLLPFVAVVIVVIVVVDVAHTANLRSFYHLIDSVAQAKLNNTVHVFDLNKNKNEKKKKTHRKTQQKHFSFALAHVYISYRCEVE